MRTNILKISIFTTVLIVLTGLCIIYITKTREETSSKIIPSVFSIKQISYFQSEAITVNNYEIYLKEQNLYLRITDNVTGELRQETHISTPTPKDWQKFNQSLLNSGACSWDKRYVDMSFEDGGETEINIEFHNCKIQTTLINVTPYTYEVIEQSIIKNLFNGKHLYDLENSIKIM